MCQIEKCPKPSAVSSQLLLPLLTMVVEKYWIADS